MSANDNDSISFDELFAALGGSSSGRSSRSGHGQKDHKGKQKGKSKKKAKKNRGSDFEPYPVLDHADDLSENQLFAALGISEDSEPRIQVESAPMRSIDEERMRQRAAQREEQRIRAKQWKRELQQQIANRAGMIGEPFEEIEETPGESESRSASYGDRFQRLSEADRASMSKADQILYNARLQGAIYETPRTIMERPERGQVQRIEGGHVPLRLDIPEEPEIEEVEDVVEATEAEDIDTAQTIDLDAARQEDAAALGEERQPSSAAVETAARSDARTLRDSEGVQPVSSSMPGAVSREEIGYAPTDVPEEPESPRPLMVELPSAQIPSRDKTQWRNISEQHQATAQWRPVEGAEGATQVSRPFVGQEGQAAAFDGQPMVAQPMPGSRVDEVRPFPGAWPTQRSGMQSDMRPPQGQPIPFGSQSGQPMTQSGTVFQPLYPMQPTGQGGIASPMQPNAAGQPVPGRPLDGQPMPFSGQSVQPGSGMQGAFQPLAVSLQETPAVPVHQETMASEIVEDAGADPQASQEPVLSQEEMPVAEAVVIDGDMQEIPVSAQIPQEAESTIPPSLFQPIEATVISYGSTGEIGIEEQPPESETVSPMEDAQPPSASMPPMQPMPGFQQPSPMQPSVQQPAVSAAPQQGYTPTSDVSAPYQGYPQGASMPPQQPMQSSQQMPPVKPIQSAQTVLPAQQSLAIVKRDDQEKAKKKDNIFKESPFGIALIVLAAICAILAVLLLTGIIDLSGEGSTPARTTSSSAQPGPLDETSSSAAQSSTPASTAVYSYIVRSADGTTHRATETAMFNTDGFLDESVIEIDTASKEESEMLVEQLKSDFGDSVKDSSATDNKASVTLGITRDDLNKDAYTELLSTTMMDFKVIER